jgi:hypothetical protein
MLDTSKTYGSMESTTPQKQQYSAQSLDFNVYVVQGRVNSSGRRGEPEGRVSGEWGGEVGGKESEWKERGMWGWRTEELMISPRSGEEWWARGSWMRGKRVTE